MCSVLFIFGAPKTLLKLLKEKESLRKLKMQTETNFPICSNNKTCTKM